MILKEALYNEIEVSSKKPISKREIVKYMNLARRTRSYIKFTVSNGKFYIMVTYQRNGKVNKSSNIRHNQSFQRNLVYMENRGYAEGTWAYFIEMWINKFAKDDLR